MQRGARSKAKFGRAGFGRAGFGRAGLLLAALLLALYPLTDAEAQTRPRPRPDMGDAPKPRPAPRANVAATPTATVPTAIAPVAIGPVTIGPVTKQPLPRYVSLKGGEGNARRGPGLTHRIDWVFTTKGTPLRVTAEYENWRRVEDFEGFGGWVHFTLLSVARTVLVTQDMAQFHTLPDPISPVAFQAERGVLGRIVECHIDWCRINADGRRGWAPKSVMWGVDSNEMID